jgi:hypothetical protein
MRDCGFEEDFETSYGFVYSGYVSDYEGRGRGRF